VTARGKSMIRRAMEGNEGLPEKRYRTADKLARFMIMDCRGKPCQWKKTAPRSTTLRELHLIPYQII